ncbi:membrane protein [Croceibacterium mercuriale]|uniref:Membrane protein n=2 Tax=Croceibacterium mercuriale TaxID=1572751 RepID=A0A0B2BX91_9SPHN|nr:membrane protein [Croceibacterium mercuriale]
MLDYMVLPFKRYAQFTGRARRMEFWSFALLITIVNTVLLGIMFASTPGLFDTATPEDPFAMYGAMFSGVGVLILLWFLATFIPSIAVSVRRLHDRNMSGWWYLGFVVASLIPFVGLIASIAMLVIMFLPGTPGENRFGPDPKLDVAAAY